MSDQAAPRRMRSLRTLTIAIGVLALGTVFLADRLPGIASPGFGTAQWALLVFGVMLLVAGALGPRFPAAYRGFALVALNTVLLLLAAELGVRVFDQVLRLLPSSGASETVTLPYYAAQPWTAAMYDETSRVNELELYEPYAIWKREPFAGTVINVDAEGRRVTPASDCSAATRTLFAFGGSTMFGLGAPDDGTIPAFLQRSLGPDVCVVNFGELGYISTQSLMLLLRQLQHGNVPDLVLFYDGVNDVLAGSIYGQAGLHLEANRIAWLLRGGASVPARILGASRLANLIARDRIEQMAGEGPVRFTVRDDLSDDAVADSITDLYVRNLSAVRALGREFGFDAAFFWQPTTLTTRKPLHPVEERERDQAWAQAVRLYPLVQTRIEAAASDDASLFDLRGVFDSLDAAVFFDWHHLTPEGNRIVADAMLDSLRVLGMLNMAGDSAVTSH